MANIFGINFSKKKENSSENVWSFRRIVAIEEALFNNTLERFYDLGISGLVRENIQNSLDGKLQGSLKPVKVIIRTGNMNESDIPGIDEIKNHIRSLKGENSYTRETIQHMKDCMETKNVPYISFEDCNTKGLTGAEHGENIQEGDTWGIYAYKKGVHHAENNNEIESERGGSHGVGKIASNAASDLHMMFFANCDEYGKEHIGGTVELIEHELNGGKYRATGYFTREEGDQYYPFENNFGPVFSKTTRGLKIIVPYLREQFQGKEKIIQTVCDNFFVAILKNKLEVIVDDVLIDNKTILKIVHDSSIYPEQDYVDIRTNFTPLYLESYLEKTPMNIVIKDKEGMEFSFLLYFMYNDKIKKGRVAIVRGIGMKIEDKKIGGHVNTSYNAVMIPKTAEGDVFLKSLENESHTKVSYEHIKNMQLQNNAKRFINNIEKEIKIIIADFIAKENPADGKIDTSELIYSVERNFKKALSKQVETVQINKGKKNGKKDIVKVKTKVTKRKKEKDPDHSVKPRTPKINTKMDKKRYSVNTELVKRLVIKDKEKIAFDFSKEPEYSGETNCDISFVIVDGIGHTDETEFNISRNYTEIVDKKTNMICAVEDNTIKNVSIIDGKVDLEMKIADKFNSSMKFIYYVEV